MTFYLQQGVPDNRAGWQVDRVFLDDHMHAECFILQAVEAPTWLDARAEVVG
jgi:hypothetical protein